MFCNVSVTEPLSVSGHGGCKITALGLMTLEANEPNDKARFMLLFPAALIAKILACLTSLIIGRLCRRSNIFITNVSTRWRETIACMLSEVWTLPEHWIPNQKKVSRQELKKTWVNLCCTSLSRNSDPQNTWLTGPNFLSHHFTYLS